jgi:hypothetical protein
MNRAVLTAAAGAAGALALVGAFAGGYALANGHTVTRTRVLTRTVPGPTVIDIRVVYRVRHHKKPPSPSPSPAGAAVTFGCQIRQTGVGQENFNVTTTRGAT